MINSENINIPYDKSEIPTSKNNLLHGGIYDNHLLPSTEYLNKNDGKEKNISIKNNINNNNSGSSSKKNKKTKGELDSYSKKEFQKTIKKLKKRSKKRKDILLTI